MANVADAVEDLFRELNNAKRLRAIHEERVFLNRLDFTEDQLRAFDARVTGVAERFERIVGPTWT